MLAGRISLKAYEMVSDGNVEFYSIVRHCVVSNLTLTHLMQKIAADAATTCPTNKTAADVFEAMAGALYKEHYENGSQHEFNAWVDDTFMPLIETAKAAFRDDNRKRKKRLEARKTPTRKTHKSVLNAVRSSGCRIARQPKSDDEDLDVYDSSEDEDQDLDGTDSSVDEDEDMDGSSSENDGTDCSESDDYSEENSDPVSTKPLASKASKKQKSWWKPWWWHKKTGKAAQKKTASAATKAKKAVIGGKAVPTAKAKAKKSRSRSARKRARPERLAA